MPPANFFDLSAAWQGCILGPVIHMKLIRRILAMSEPAWWVTLRALQLSCAVLFAAFVLLLDAGAYSADTSRAYGLARELASLPQLILLLAVIAGAVIEEQQMK